MNPIMLHARDNRTKKKTIRIKFTIQMMETRNSIISRCSSFVCRAIQTWPFIATKNNHILHTKYLHCIPGVRKSRLYSCVKFSSFCIFSHFLLLLHWFHFGIFHYLFVLHHSFCVWGVRKTLLLSVRR